LRSSLISFLLVTLLALFVFSFLRQRQTSPAASTAQSTQTPAVSSVKPEAEGDSFSLGGSLWARESERPDYSRHGLDSLQENLGNGRRNAIVRASERVAPAVVSVTVSQTQVVNTPVRDFFGYFYIPSERKVQNLGSGFIFNSRGYILTNQHVVDQASGIKVSTSLGETFDATLVGQDDNTDLAVLKIDPGKNELAVAPLGDSDDLCIGEWAIAIGSPFGLLLDDPQPTVTVGVISAVGRDIRPDRGTEGKVYANMIQTDAAINPGNSGGPLLNALGEVVGINTFIFTQSGGSVGMGFAIPINRARRIAEDLIRGGKVRHPWLGIRVQDLSREIATGLGYKEGEYTQGVLVADVQRLSPAAASGTVRPGDLVAALNGRHVRSSEDWAGEMLDVRVGEPVNLTLLRDGREVSAQLTPVEQPTDRAERYRTGLGFSMIDLTPEVRSQLEVRVDHGAVILEITDSDLVAAGTLLQYDVLYQIGNVQIKNAEQAVKILADIPRGRYGVLFIERDNRSIRRYITG